MGLTPGDRIAKANYLAKMAERVIELHLDITYIDDKDHY
jgi:DNA-directed RNA polymerase beta subunit